MCGCEQGLRRVHRTLLRKNGVHNKGQVRQGPGFRVCAMVKFLGFMPGVPVGERRGWCLGRPDNTEQAFHLGSRSTPLTPKHLASGEDLLSTGGFYSC